MSDGSVEIRQRQLVARIRQYVGFDGVHRTVIELVVAADMVKWA